MKAIDRVMRAYLQTRSLTDEQQQQVRGELSSFIQDLLLGKQPASDTANDVRPDDRNGPIGTT
jgi:hypothetical protein